MQLPEKETIEEQIKKKEDEVRSALKRIISSYNSYVETLKEEHERIETLNGDIYDLKYTLEEQKRKH